jgi:hypothetical protein
MLNSAGDYWSEGYEDGFADLEKNPEFLENPYYNDGYDEGLSDYERGLANDHYAEEE